MCNYLNKYTNLNDAHYIRYTSFKNNAQKMYYLFVWYFLKLSGGLQNSFATFLALD
jgi:hypothetical protein